ncbi:hypothetical protein PU01_23970 [Hafnia alvei]|nr:hypothetical protein PU01_23970 [Hafnia alvei]
MKADGVIWWYQRSSVIFIIVRQHKKNILGVMLGKADFRHKKTASRRPRHCFIDLIIRVNFLGAWDET